MSRLDPYTWQFGDTIYMMHPSVHSSIPFSGVPSSSRLSLSCDAGGAYPEYMYVERVSVCCPRYCGAAFVIVLTVMPKHGPRMLSEISFKSRWMHKGGRDIISMFNVCCRRASCDCFGDDALAYYLIVVTWSSTKSGKSYTTYKYRYFQYMVKKPR